MAFRSMERRALCAVCREPAFGGCLRCGSPRCAPHEIAIDRRCSACETGYQQGVDTALRRSATRLDWARKTVVGSMFFAMCMTGVLLPCIFVFLLFLPGILAVILGAILSSFICGYLVKEMLRLAPVSGVGGTIAALRGSFFVRAKRRAFLKERIPGLLPAAADNQASSRGDASPFGAPGASLKPDVVSAPQDH